MNDSYSIYERKINIFILKCKEILNSIISSKEPRDEKRAKEKNLKKEKVNNFGDRLIETLNQLIFKVSDVNGDKESYEEAENIDTKDKDYEVIPVLFHKFLIFYFNNFEKFREIFNEIDLNWIYDIFKTVNEHSRHFYILEDTVVFLKKKIHNRDRDPVWFDSTYVKENFQELVNSYEYQNLRSLILLVNYLINRKIKSIKLL